MSDALYLRGAILTDAERQAFENGDQSAFNNRPVQLIPASSAGSHTPAAPPGIAGTEFAEGKTEHAATFAAARAMVGLLGRAKHVHIESHTTFGDGGGGIFDVKAVGSYVDNNGTFIVAGTAALVRRGWAACNVDVRWFGAQGDNATDDYTAITAAIAFAVTTTKTVLFPYGIYLTSASIVLPFLSTTSGVQLIGAAPADEYQALPGTWSTVIRATAAMGSVITNHSGANIGYYNSIRNLVIDGNHLADYGYTNGQQDKGSHCSIVQCLVGGLRLLDATNASVYEHLSCTLNGTGLISDGTKPSGTTFRNCKFRENTLEGVLLVSGVQLSFYDCVSESNHRHGVWLRGGDDPLQIINFRGLHSENNDGLQFAMSTTGTVQPNSVTVSDSLFVCPDGGRALHVEAGQLSLRHPSLIANGSFGADYFQVDSGASYVDIESTDAALAGLVITGTGTDKVTKSYVKVSGAATGRGFDRATKVNVLNTQINVASSRALLPIEVCGQTITNYGQGAANCSVELPEATEGFSFTVIIATAQAANYWRVQAVGGGAKISLNGGALQGAATIAVPTVGATIRFRAFLGAGYYWSATTDSGTWV